MIDANHMLVIDVPEAIHLATEELKDDKELSVSGISNNSDEPTCAWLLE